MDDKYDLAQSNYHVAPGDILLLSSADKGVLNRTGQWVKRQQDARYTHAAVVVDATKIVDAMPGVGVSFRVWRDIEANYDIDGSCIARHRGLAGDPNVWGQVYRSALYFVRQPYKFRTALLDPGSIRDQSGMVCSHFVAALLERLGVRVSEYPVTATLPVDIDRYTGASAEWRQFKLSESGLFSGAQRPESDDPYWNAIHDATLSQLSEDDRARLQSGKAVTPAVDAATSPDDLDRLISSADAVLERAAERTDQFEKLFRESTQLQYDASRTAAKFAEMMLALTEGLARGSEEALRISLALLQSEGPLGGKLEPITGAGFLAQWEALYRKDALPPMFLHEENSALNRERHRTLLDHSVKTAKEQVARHLEMFGELASTMGRLGEAMKSGPVSPESIEKVADAAARLQESAWFLRGEDVSAISDRVDGIGARHQELIEWAKAPGRDEDLVLRAFDTFNEISRYDLDTVYWLRMAEPALSKWITVLRDTTR